MTSVFLILVDITKCAEQSSSKHAHASSIERECRNEGNEK